MFGRIRINYDQRADALVIPRTALLEDGGTPAVFTVKGGKAVRSELKLGYVDGEWVEVRDGLRAGDPVVVAGKSALREGSAVQVINDKAAPAPARLRGWSPNEFAFDPSAGARAGPAPCARELASTGGVRHPAARHHRDDDADTGAVRADRAGAASRSTCCRPQLSP